MKRKRKALRNKLLTKTEVRRERRRSHSVRRREKKPILIQLGESWT